MITLAQTGSPNSLQIQRDGWTIAFIDIAPGKEPTFLFPGPQLTMTLPEITQSIELLAAHRKDVAEREAP